MYFSPSDVVQDITLSDVRRTRVTLINMPIREQARPNNPPIGLALLGARLREWGAIPTIVDLNGYRILDQDAETQGLKNGRTLTTREAAKLIAVHFETHGDQHLIAMSGLITTLKWQINTAEIVRNLQPGALLASGGGLATQFREILFTWIPELDAVAHSEGDDVILKMAADAKIVNTYGHSKAERTGKLAPYCRGEKAGRLKFLYDGGRPRSLDEIPFPAYDLLDPDVLNGYLQTPVWGESAQNSSATSFTMSKSISTVSSRGCPFACKFCFRGAQGERNYGIRSAHNLADEMRHYIDAYGVDFVGLVDDNFMVSRKRIEVLADILSPIHQELGLRWGTHGRLDEAADLTRDSKSGKVISQKPFRVDEMARSGCKYIGFGAESASPKILEQMGKGGFMLSGGTVKINGYAVPKTMVEGIRNTRAAEIHANCTWIMGYPEETLDDIKASIAFIAWQKDEISNSSDTNDIERQRLRDSVNTNMFTATAYPGTEMFKHPHVQNKLSKVFGLKFDSYGKPQVSQSFKHYVLELNDATKMLTGADDEPLNFGSMPDTQFVEVRNMIDSGNIFNVLDI